MLSPRRDTTAADLLRWMAGWLVVVVALQGLQAARLLAFGPLHRHDAVHGHAAHTGQQRHWHAAADAAIPADGAAADWDAAAFALTAALALMALGLARGGADRRRHVWRAASPWALAVTHAPPPERPPRPA